MRIESNSKTWVEAVILQLVQEGKLSVDDTVDRWLPGLLRAHGSEITIRELMSDSSGLIDDNDVFASPSAAQRLSRACRRPEAEGGAARGRRPDTSESGSRGLAALVHSARRLAAPGRPARHHLPPLQHRLEHRRPDRRQGRRQAAPAALPRAHLPAARATPHRLRPARADRRSARERLCPRRQRHPHRHDRPAPRQGSRRRDRHRRQGRGTVPHRLHQRHALRPTVPHRTRVGGQPQRLRRPPRLPRQRRRQRLQIRRRLRHRRQPRRRAPPQRRKARRERVRALRGSGKQPLLCRLTAERPHQFVEPARTRVEGAWRCLPTSDSCSTGSTTFDRF